MSASPDGVSASATNRAEPAPALGWLNWQGATRQQLETLVITWLTWVLGAMNVMLYAMVLTPALQDLLAGSGPAASVPTGQIGWYGGLIVSLFLIGWAVGGVLLGALADALGRRPILLMAVVLIALSTGLAALSREWWHLASLRLVTGVGIGGLWAAGAALVAEAWADRHRAKAAGFLQSAWGFGFFLAAAVTLALKDFGWRSSFAVGSAMIVSAWLVHRRLHDSPRWQRAHMDATPPNEHVSSKIRELFLPGQRRSTWAGTAMAFVAVFGLWGATNWTPSLVRSITESEYLNPAETATRVSIAIMLLNVGALIGYFSFGPLAERFGRRPMFAFMYAGSLIVMPLTFMLPHRYATVLALLPVLGFFSKGIFGGFPLYLPELFPTRLRSTGAGFCYNAGRIVASVSPFLTGVLVSTFGSFGRAASAMAAAYVLGLIILWWAPETKDRPLPD